MIKVKKPRYKRGFLKSCLAAKSNLALRLQYQ